jgi:hypothetical protein
MCNNRENIPTKRSAGRSLRKLCGGILYILFASPYLIVAVPLSLYLLIHVVGGFIGIGRPSHAWTFVDLLGCAGCLAAMIGFAVIAVGHLVLLIICAHRNES